MTPLFLKAQVAGGAILFSLILLTVIELSVGKAPQHLSVLGGRTKFTFSLAAPQGTRPKTPRGLQT